MAPPAEIRANGYAVGLQECAPGWNSVAAPVFWDSAVLGAVVVLKAAEVIPAPLDRYIDVVKSAAADMGRLVGAPAPERYPAAKGA
ncbi:hypothetical protein ACWGJT_26550 [Streptomyces xantholiticus]